MGSAVRHPAVAGRFYPGDPKVLLRDVKSYVAPGGEKISALGCVVPHAGYMYSGHVAGAVYARLSLPQRYVILCPNHTGMGEPLAIMSAGAWRTPLGEVRIDQALAGELMRNYRWLAEDVAAHRSEHALEVQLPFLQALQPEFSFVPIALGTANYEVLASLGEAIAAVLGAQKEKTLIIASSDMNHYEPDSITRVKDRKAIEKILALDPEGLYDVIRREDISMCGYGPAIAMLTAAKELGASKAELVKYATSADTSGDRSAVVGYAGIIVS